MCSPGLADGISGHHARRTSLRGHCHYFAMATSPLPDLDSELSRARVALHGILGCRRPPLGFWRNLGNREGRLDSVVALTGRKTEHRPQQSVLCFSLCCSVLIRQSVCPPSSVRMSISSFAAQAPLAIEALEKLPSSTTKKIQKALDLNDVG